jgi:ParB family chromosome partitioning protein
MTEPRSRKRFTVDNLFADTRPRAVGVQELTDAKIIDLDRIQPDPSQPRRTFDPERLEELAASIRAEGVLQPIVVRFDSDNDRYVIVHGERRWRASREAGLSDIPALVRDVPVERRLLQQLMENVVRDDLNAVDRAAALRALRSQLDNPPWETVAAAVGIKRSRLFQLLGTEKLSPSAQEDIQAGRLSEKQSRALQGLSEDKQQALHKLILEQNLSANDALRLSRAFRTMDIPEGSSAEQTLNGLAGFMFAKSGAGMAAQTRTLLSAVRIASTGTDRSRKHLASLATTLNTGKFRETRFDTEINAIARSLAALQADKSIQPEPVQRTLRELRDTLDAMLD